VELYQNRVEKGEIPIFRGHVLSEEDQIMRRQILNIMTRLKTQWSEKDLACVPYLQEISHALREMINDCLVKIEGNTCEVPELGRPFLRNICMAFDLRLIRSSAHQSIAKAGTAQSIEQNEKDAKPQIFSKTI